MVNTGAPVRFTAKHSSDSLSPRTRAPSMSMPGGTGLQQQRGLPPRGPAGRADNHSVATEALFPHGPSQRHLGGRGGFTQVRSSSSSSCSTPSRRAQRPLLAPAPSCQAQPAPLSPHCLPLPCARSTRRTRLPTPLA